MDTAKVMLQSARGDTLVARALFDSGSDTSFVSEWVAQSLRLPRKPVNVSVSGIQGTDTGTAVGEVQVTLRALTESPFSFNLVALVLRKITNQIPHDRIALQKWDHLDGLTLVDPDFAHPGRVDVIIGSDVGGHLLLDDSRKGNQHEPVPVLRLSVIS